MSPFRVRQHVSVLRLVLRNPCGIHSMKPGMEFIYKMDFSKSWTLWESKSELAGLGEKDFWHGLCSPTSEVGKPFDLRATTGSKIWKKGCARYTKVCIKYTQIHAQPGLLTVRNWGPRLSNVQNSSHHGSSVRVSQYARCGIYTFYGSILGGAIYQRWEISSVFQSSARSNNSTVLSYDFSEWHHLSGCGFELNTVACRHETDPDMRGRPELWEHNAHHFAA